MAAPLHDPLFGPNSVKVIVPVGDTPPARVAVSEILPPTLIPAEACVLMVGLTLLTVTDSFASLQAPFTPLLLLSPL